MRCHRTCIAHRRSCRIHALGNGIYIRDDTNIVPGFTHVGPGDVRGFYPSVTVTLAGTGITAKYAAWTKVYSPVFDYQKAIYNDIGPGNVCFVGAGDTRSRNVVIPQVTYAAGSTVLAGSEDLLHAAPLVAFGPNEFFADTNNNGQWTAGESKYLVAGVHTNLVKAGDTRLSYVGNYLPGTVVGATDLDVGTPIKAFPASQSYYDADLSTTYTYGEWIYNQAAGALVAGTVRASAVDWTDKGMATAGQLGRNSLASTMDFRLA